MNNKLFCTAGIALGFILPGAVKADIIVTLEQSGSDVVATASGTADISALEEVYDSGLAVGFVGPSDDTLALGTGDLGYFMTAGGPASFGSGNFTTATSSSGDALGVAGSGTIWLPNGYVSGSALSSMILFR